jgi:hypothetical protein
MAKRDMDNAVFRKAPPAPVRSGGEVRRVTSTLSRADRLGAIRVRLGFGRSSYRVDPGLYALGSPGASSPVLVSANYKLSFDALRAPLAGLSAWLLVLDTVGVNVWCAAGKGTFGTDELCRRIADGPLSRVVTHRRVIVPQLGAPGVAAHEVRRRTGFEVVYGPVRSADIPAFLAAGCEATQAMRRVSFGFRERAAVVPVELNTALKYGVPIAVLLLLFGQLPMALAVLGAILAGAVAAPLLLPWLPGRAFALKGAWTGLVAGALPLLARPAPIEAAACALLGVCLSSFLSMNFTGASTYTSLSGVKREMRVALPLQLAGALVSLGSWAAWLVLAGGGAP